MDSELQIALVATGIGAVVLIFAYNKWQEHKHKRKAERTFKSSHRDVLLEQEQGTAAADERREPTLGAPDSDALAPMTVLGDSEIYKRGAPGLPAMLDPRADCAIYLEAMDGLAVAALWQAQEEEFRGGPSKPLRWFGFSEEDNLWRPLQAGSDGSCHWFCAALQLVDRRGALGEHELMRFSGSMQRIADRIGALPPALPTSAETLRVADELDRFCADVDIQIGVNLLAVEAPFSGEALTRFAGQEGLTAGSDGRYHARTADGHSLFSVGNLEEGALTGERAAVLETRGLTLVIDVPLVRDGSAAFDRLMECATNFASDFNASIVDDNQAAFGPEAAVMIREQIRHFQDRMQTHDIAAGSPLALRLFSL